MRHVRLVHDEAALAGAGLRDVALEDLQTLELCAGQRPALATIKQNRYCEGLISPGEDTTHVAPLFTPRKQRPQLGKSHASQANAVGNLPIQPAIIGLDHP